jgi:hypothetical protein
VEGDLDPSFVDVDESDEIPVSRSELAMDLSGNLNGWCENE